jgi:4-amino-4-deoxy-L-arabinose transferase-like glycosyltransferase
VPPDTVTALPVRDDPEPLTGLPVAGNRPSRATVALLVLAILIGGLTHGWNTFRYPLYLTDEGIYTEQAWSVVHEGRLTPYTYFYDHAPLGWLTLAGWVAPLPGQFEAFGTPINTGRVLMVLVHMGSVFLLFEVVRRYSGSVAAAFLATFVFNVSPLAVYYQRQVLLDNMMVFWVLFGLYLVARQGGRVVGTMGSGLAFGLAMVTKENAVFLLPGFGYLMHRGIATQSNRRFCTSFCWFAVAAPVAVYALLAVIKNEMLPAGMDFNLSRPPADHVSLLYTMWWQVNRTPTTSNGSAFAELLRGSWLAKDWYLLAAGTVATVSTLLLGLGDRKHRAPMLGAALLALGYGFYLTRSVLLDFYVVPLVPLLALNIALLYAHLTRRWKPLAVGALTVGIIAVPLVQPHGYLMSYNDQHRLQLADQYRLSLTDLQAAQVAWIRANIPTSSRIITDDDIWVTLHDGKPAYPNAHSHWKASADPDVRDKVFHSDWHRLDYVVLSNKMRPAMQQNNSNGQESWILTAIDQHGQRVWQASRGDVELEIIKINSS